MADRDEMHRDAGEPTEGLTAEAGACAAPPDATGSSSTLSLAGPKGSTSLDATLSKEPAVHAAAGTAGTTPRLRIPHYEIIEEVARGGMGVVYKARHAELNRTVALKMILAGDFASPSAVERFRAEARAVAKLEHSGIVPIYDIGEVEGQNYFAMQFVAGGTGGGFRAVSARRTHPRPSHRSPGTRRPLVPPEPVGGRHAGDRGVGGPA